MAPPLTHSSIPKKFLKISKEFDNFVCIFPGVSYGLQVSCKAVSCVGPKPKFDLFF